MAGRIALDSNIVISFIKGDGKVKQLIDNSSELLIPIPVAGELIYGAMKSQNVEQNLSKNLSFIERTTLINCDINVSEHYGRIKAYLKSQGTPIPENDIWIAACCFAAEVSLATRDNHFSVVPNLEIITLES